MKLSKAIATIGFGLLASVAAGTNAQSSVPSGCTWTYVSTISIPYGAAVTLQCKLNGAAVATATSVHSYGYSSCNFSVAPGYVSTVPVSSSGSCPAPQINKLL